MAPVVVKGASGAITGRLVREQQRHRSQPLAVVSEGLEGPGGAVGEKDGALVVGGGVGQPVLYGLEATPRAASVPQKSRRNSLNRKENRLPRPSTTSSPWCKAPGAGWADAGIFHERRPGWAASRGTIHRCAVYL